MSAFSNNAQLAEASSASTVTISSYAVSAGDNKILTAGLAIRHDGTVATITSITHNGTGMTSRANISGAYGGTRNGRCALYDLQLGSSTPTGDLVATVSATQDGIALGAVYATGLAQQAPEATNTQHQPSSTSTISTSVTTVTDNAEMVDCCGEDRNSGGINTASGSSTQVVDTDPTADATMGMSYLTGGTAGSHTFRWDDDTARTQPWLQAVAAYELAAAGPSATESLPIGVTESAAITQLGIFGSDTTPLGLTDAAVSLGVTSVGIGEGIPIGILESTALIPWDVITGTESLPIGMVEVVDVYNSFSTTDLLALGLVETSAFLALVLGSDLCGIGLTDESSVLARFSAAESLGLGVGETSANAVLISSSDIFGIPVTDAVQTLTVSLAVAETVGIGLVEAVLLTRSIFTTDSLPVNLDEAVLLAKTLVASESLPVGLTDVASFMVNISTADSLPLGLQESMASMVLLITVADDLSISLTEAAGIVGTIFSAGDSIGLGLLDTAGLAYQLSGTDALSVGMTEAAAIESLALPLPTFIPYGVFKRGEKAPSRASYKPRSKNIW